MFELQNCAMTKTDLYFARPVSSLCLVNSKICLVADRTLSGLTQCMSVRTCVCARARMIVCLHAITCIFSLFDCFMTF